MLLSLSLQALQAAFLRMKEKYLSISVCAVKKSRWEVVRSIVMFGKGEWAILPTLAPKSDCTQKGKVLNDGYVSDSAEFGFGWYGF